MEGFRIALLTVCAFALLIASQTACGQKIEYFHTDIFGNVVAISDEDGNVIERRVYEPYGLPQTPIQDGPGFTGHDMDGESGLIYMQQRYYDPQIGQFLSPDPMAVDPATAWNFNRYNYAANNPYRNTDPDGRNAVTAFGGVLYETGQLLLGNGFDGSRVLGALADGYDGQGAGFAAAAFEDATTFIPVGAVLGAAAKSVRLVKLADDAPTELVQRAMSKAELDATIETGLMRGGRPGTHHVSDAVNSNAHRAQQRLALESTPDVRATLEVPSGTFSKPTTVQPKNGMPGGGTERIATGEIPVKIRRSDEY